MAALSDGVTIARVQARSVWNSAGLPALEVEIALSDGASGRAIAQSGMSGGHVESALTGESIFAGHRRRVRHAVDVIERHLAPALVRQPSPHQAGADAVLRRFWPGGDLSHAQTAAASIALASACATSAGVPLWRHLASGESAARLPLPEVEIVGGGAHADMRSDIQDIMVVYPGARSYAESLELSGEVFHRVRGEFSRRGFSVGLCEKGGLWPAYENVEQALDIVTRSLEATGLALGRDAGLALDFAADGYHDAGWYRLRDQAKPLDSDAMLDLVLRWLDRYPILSVEDPFAASDSSAYCALMDRVGHRVQVIGDDLHDSNAAAIAESGGRAAPCNAIMLKPAKAGTLTDTIDALAAARRRGWGVVMAGRSGDSEDTAVMHIAVAFGVGQFKIGALARSERACKFNEGLRIAERLPAGAYAADSELAIARRWRSG